MLSELPEMGPEPRKSRKRSKEKDFLTDLKHSFEMHGAFWHKIADSPVSMIRGARFEKAKPFDAISVYRGIPIAIEAKFIPDYKAFGIKSLRPSQVEGLTRFVNSGGLGFVFLNIRRTADKLRQIRRLNRLMIFQFGEVGMLEGGSNLRKTELEEYPYIEGSKKRYDLSEFLNGLKGTRPRWNP